MLTKINRIGEKMDINDMKHQISKGKKFILINKHTNKNITKIPYNCILRRRHVIDGGKIIGNYPSRGYLRSKNILDNQNSNFQNENWIFVKLIKNMSFIDNNIQMDENTLDIISIGIDGKYQLYTFHHDFDILILLDDDLYQNMLGQLYEYK